MNKKIYIFPFILVVIIVTGWLYFEKSNQRQDAMDLSNPTSVETTTYTSRNFNTVSRPSKK